VKGRQTLAGLRFRSASRKKQKEQTSDSLRGDLLADFFAAGALARNGAVLPSKQKNPGHA